MRLEHDDGKVTVSLGVREWLALFVALIGLVSYVVRLEMAVRDGQTFKVEQVQTDKDNAKEFQSNEKRMDGQEYRVRALEDKAGLRHWRGPENTR